MTEILSGCAVRAAAQAEQCCDDRPTSYDQDVAAFHERFGIPVTGRSGPPALMDQKTLDYRVMFLREELHEFIDCCADGNLAGALDALVDLSWVAIGTAHYMGCPFDAAWAEVRRANMDKVGVAAGGDPNKPYRDSGPQVVKPPGWLPPDIEGVVAKARDEWLTNELQKPAESALDTEAQVVT